MQRDGPLTPASQASLTSAASVGHQQEPSQLADLQQQAQPAARQAVAAAVAEHGDARPMHTAAAVQAGSAVAEQQQTDLAQSEVSVPESLVEDAIMELQGHTDRCMAT